MGAMYHVIKDFGTLTLIFSTNGHNTTQKTVIFLEKLKLSDLIRCDYQRTTNLRDEYFSLVAILNNGRSDSGPRKISLCLRRRQLGCLKRGRVATCGLKTERNILSFQRQKTLAVLSSSEHPTAS